jgi:signal peptidase II
MARDRRPLFFAVLILGLVADQALKSWVRDHLLVNQSPGYPIPGVFELTLTYNKGIAFGMLQGHGQLMTPIALLIAGIAIWHVLKHPHETRWTMTLAGLMACGALGNLYDRLRFGEVTDMFSFRLISFPVFNVADSCITIATCMLIITWLREPFQKDDGPTPHSPATEVKEAS